MNEDRHEDREVATAALRALAQSLRGEQAPKRVEQALVAEFRRRGAKPNRWSFWWRVLVPAAAVAVLAVVAVSLTSKPELEVREPVVVRELTTDYMPVGFGMPLDTSEFTQVIRISLPRSEMTQFGLPAFDNGGPDRVQADVVLGEDGVARAIRFVQ